MLATIDDGIRPHLPLEVAAGLLTPLSHRALEELSAWRVEEAAADYEGEDFTHHTSPPSFDITYKRVCKLCTQASHTHTSGNTRCSGQSARHSLGCSCSIVHVPQWRHSTTLSKGCCTVWLNCSFFHTANFTL